MAPEIAAFLQSLGWEVNLEKSSLTTSQSQFRVSRSSLLHGSRGSSPGRSPARQSASRSARSHEKDTRDSKGIAVLSGTDQFLCTVS